MAKTSVWINKLRNNDNDRTGFTIVELLVVIVVIGILAAITIVSYTGITQRAVASSLQSDLTNASQQIKIYQVTNGNFPNLINDCPNPAASNMCIKSSSGNTYQYSVSNATNPQFFNLSATNTNNSSYYITNDTSPVSGILFNNTSTGPSGTIQTWTVPTTGNYIIEVWGAQGGSQPEFNYGGRGAKMQGTFALTAGQVLKILVGQQGVSGNPDDGCGGGGGSFVTASDNTPLIVAGGGSGDGADQAGISAVISTTSTANGDGSVAGSAGPSGGGANDGGGGGGLTGNGSNGATGGGGLSFTNGGLGGTGLRNGGFGGGGAGGTSTEGAGGGGGYGGGPGGAAGVDSGGGGSSYNSGTNQSNISGVRIGQGLVAIHN